MKNIVTILFVASVLLTVQSCSSTKNASKNSSDNSEMLYNNKWYLSELNGKPYTFVGHDNKYASLQFTKGETARVAGNTGCNNIMGSADISKGNSLKFGALATTKMACAGNDNKESEFLLALDGVTSYNISDTQLVLKNGETVLARLNGVSKETADQLGGRWELNYISGPKITFEGLYPDNKPFISFNFADKSIMGNTSCNGFSSKYTMKGNTIHFSDGLQTMMYCEGGGEETFMTMLKKVNRFAENDNTLTFMIDAVAVMRFGQK